MFRDTQHHEIPWNYTKVEIVADGIIHAAGLTLGLWGGVALFSRVLGTGDHLQIAATSVYLFGLLSMLGLSATYNLWPRSPTKWLLRRLDHSAIYVLIASTYTPLLAQIGGLHSTLLLVAVWLAAAIGIIIKMLWPGRYDRTSIVLYLLMGCAGISLYDSAITAFSKEVLQLVVLGGLLYASGIIFHIWESLRFQNVLWHSFVLAAASCHYTAIFWSLTRT